MANIRRRAMGIVVFKKASRGAAISLAETYPIGVVVDYFYHGQAVRLLIVGHSKNGASYAEKA